MLLAFGARPLATARDEHLLIYEAALDVLLLASTAVSALLSALIRRGRPIPYNDRM